MDFNFRNFHKRLLCYSLITTTQYYRLLHPSLRTSNLTGLIMFPQNEKDINKVYEEWVLSDITPKQFASG